MTDYFIFLGVSMIILFIGNYFYSKFFRKPEDLSTFENLSEYNSRNGDFVYFQKGFIFKNKKNDVEILWSDITLIQCKQNSFDEYKLHFTLYITTEKDFFKIDNDIIGFQNFVNVINENIPVVDPLWTWQMHNKNFEVIEIFKR